uniref:Phosphoserine transaminase n=1 Tax=Rhabditophanes sp. KR3021 TaxID=114890 RepID=A0AC35TLS2_9BILA
MSTQRSAINFGAGPAQLPLDVLNKAKDELLDYNGSGISIMAIPLNIAKSINGNKAIANYLVTGTWSQKAAQEAKKYIQVNLVTPATKQFLNVPDASTWNIAPDASYFYYCANETVHGIEIPDIQVPEGTTLVADVSSNIMTRNFDVSKHGIVYAGAQKNLGIPGVTVVIIRRDLIGKAHQSTPSILDYDLAVKNNSLYNTPNMFSLYILKLMIQHVEDKGGVTYFAKLNQEKANTIYAIINDSNGFYYSPIDKDSRSNVNIPFRIGGKDGNIELEEKFLKLAKEKNYIGLKGHRSVGGIRVSIYNAITLEEVKYLAYFLIKFQQENPLQR